MPFIQNAGTEYFTALSSSLAWHGWGGHFLFALWLVRVDS
jgi:hypothetical protein